MRRFRLILFFIILGFSLKAMTEAIQQALVVEDYQQSAALLEEEVQGDPANIEAWRLLGFSYKMLGEMDAAISSYQKVLDLNEADYDAHLALGRLYLQTQQYEDSKREFSYIHKNDETDVEALWGLARIAKAQEDYNNSISFYNQALQYLPDDIPTLLELATIYSYADELDEAISIYHTIIALDKSWAEAWIGLGRMQWWSGQSYAASENCKIALKLDATNLEYANLLDKIESENAWYPSFRFTKLQEREDDYTIDSWIQHYKLTKKLSDRLDFSLNSFWQYNQKERKRGDNTIEKWFDNSYLKFNYQAFKILSINSTFGASIHDSTATVIDGGIRLNYVWKKFKLSNSTNVGKEYFSHWEGLNRVYLNNSFSLAWKRIIFISSYKTGKVEEAPIWEGTLLSENPFVDYSLGLNYLLFKPINLKLGVGTRFMDYQNQSNLYYTPIDRRLVSLNASMYYPYKHIYLYASSLVEQDKDEKRGYSNDLELGYTISGWSLSVGFGNFKNPWYESDNVSLTLSGRF